MSIIFGVYNTNRSEDYPAVVKTVSSYAPEAGTKEEYHDENVYIRKIDLDCFGNKAWAADDTGIVTIAGHPLMTSNRQNDCQSLLNTDSFKTKLTNTTGQFALLRYDRTARELTLATDCLGVRPFYTMARDGCILFSTKLGLFKQLYQLTFNKASLFSKTLLGFPLLDTTIYNEVRCMRPNEIISFEGAAATTSKYRHWDTKTKLTEEQAIESLDEAFKAAVSLCAGDDRHHVSTLSGGLDSRTLVAELHRRDYELCCFNFSRSNTRDLYCATGYANHAGFRLDTIQVQDTQSKPVEVRLGEFWGAGTHDYYAKVERPGMLWSGNGGSVCIGQVYTNPAIVSACGRADAEEVIDAFLEQQYAFVPSSIVKNAQSIQQNIKEGLLESLTSYTGMPMLKAWQLFLWDNDQHHHIAAPYEFIDQYRLEFHIPFYNRQVLDVMAATPTEYLLRHSLYMKWLEQKYGEALQTPWQTYPGHIPCPIPIERKIKDQWSLKTPTGEKGKLLAAGWAAIRHENQQILLKPNLALICLLYVLGFDRYEANMKLAMKLMDESPIVLQ